MVFHAYQKMNNLPGIAVSSKLVGAQKWGPEVAGCGYCGFSPVRHETTLDSGHKLFAYDCPNGGCHRHWKSPHNDAWKHSRQAAADYWNKENKQ